MIDRAPLLPATLVGVLALGLVPALGQIEFDFMPDGGRGLLARLVGEQPTELAAIAVEQRDMAGWRDYLAGQGDLTEIELETLAGYLSVNFPLDESVLRANSALLAGLPPDGKELAIANCQFCHSIFSGYLMQDRDAQGWRSTFQSPFHSELAMSPKERETFVLYSATNMPLAYEDVPPELRF